MSPLPISTNTPEKANRNRDLFELAIIVLSTIVLRITGLIGCELKQTRDIMIVHVSSYILTDIEARMATTSVLKQTYYKYTDLYLNHRHHIFTSSIYTDKISNYLRIYTSLCIKSLDYNIRFRMRITFKLN